MRAGDPAHNKKLSQARAENIRQYLLRVTGHPPDQIVAVGYGSERPLVPNTTEENRARNRRVEFVIEVPPEKLLLMRLDYLYGEDWELPMPAEEDDVPVEIDPEFQIPEIDMPDEEGEFEAPITQGEYDPPLIEDLPGAD
jgi:hypothetical protein